jgi:NAD(P)-dependent dehydrogenase (short-subunit alcohol dehydrogenase family)
MARNTEIAQITHKQSAKDEKSELMKEAMLDQPISRSADQPISRSADQPISRPGRPVGIGVAVLWLCSPVASLVLGVALPVDGGFVAH